MYIVYIMQYTITRSRARDQIKVLLSTMIQEGALHSAQHLDEVGLSQRLGVSRTPLREALIALESDGLVRSVPNKGFIVVDANRALVREVFPILAALEVQALRLSGDDLIRSGPALAELNDRLKKSVVPAEQYAIDCALHRAFTQHCGNPRMLALLESHRDLSRLFDGAAVRGMANHEGSCAEHSEIISEICDANLDQAGALLFQHWKRGEQVVIDWLSERP